MAPSNIVAEAVDEDQLLDELLACRRQHDVIVQAEHVVHVNNDIVDNKNAGCC